MTGLELFGASVIYIICVVILGYAAALAIVACHRNRGLEAFVMIPFVMGTIWTVGAIVGAVWLGIKIGSMS